MTTLFNYRPLKYHSNYSKLCSERVEILQLCDNKHTHNTIIKKAISNEIEAYKKHIYQALDTKKAILYQISEGTALTKLVVVRLTEDEHEIKYRAYECRMNVHYISRNVKISPNFNKERHQNPSAFPPNDHFLFHGNTAV